MAGVFAALALTTYAILTGLVMLLQPHVISDSITTFKLCTQLKLLDDICITTRPGGLCSCFNISAKVWGDLSPMTEVQDFRSLLCISFSLSTQ